MFYTESAEVDTHATPRRACRHQLDGDNLTLPSGDHSLRDLYEYVHVVISAFYVP